MVAVVLAAVVAVILFFVLAVFSRGGAGETVHPRTNKIPLGAGELPKLTQEALLKLGYRIDHVETAPGNSTDIVASDPRPIAGQRLYVRTFEGGAVGSAEVQAALDRIKEGFHKAVLVSANGFSDEAISAASDTAVELLDRDALFNLLPAREPERRRPLGRPLTAE